MLFNNRIICEIHCSFPKCGPHKIFILFIILMSTIFCRFERVRIAHYVFICNFSKLVHSRILFRNIWFYLIIFFSNIHQKYIQIYAFLNVKTIKMLAEMSKSTFVRNMHKVWRTEGTSWCKINKKKLFTTSKFKYTLQVLYEKNIYQYIKIL